MTNISFDTLHKFLTLMDSEYNPPLSEKTNLKEFAEKLIKYAHIFYESTDDGEIKGLIAIYVNDFEKHYAYIPIVGVSPIYRSQGITKRLLQQTISFVKDMKGLINIIGIYSNNPIAIHLYHKYGFKDIEEVNGRYYMELNL